MKIAMITRADSSGGGASKVAEDLTKLLRNKNISVDYFSRSSEYIESIPLYSSFEKKLYHRLLDIGIQGYYPFEKKIIDKHDLQQHYDIFHFHDTSATVSPVTIKYLSDKNKKIIWTIHDCSVFTGGCCYPLDCKKYLNTCTHCPQLGYFGLGRNIDFTFIFHKIKKNMLQNSNITFVAPSKWIADLIYKTGHLKHYPEIISNGVNTKLFLPLSKIDTRIKLQLPQNRFIILIACNNLANKYKGIKYALEVLQKIRQELNPFILIVGKQNLDISNELEGLDFHFTGFIGNQELLNQYYASADIFLNTTIADNQPLIVLEIMASGTPNIGFATGGISEIITQGIDGYLIENNNVLELEHSIIKLYNEKAYGIMGEKARKKVEQNHNMELFFENYFKLYKLIFNQ